MMNFIKSTSDKTSFNLAFLALLNICCDAKFDLVAVEIPSLVNFALKEEQNPEVFSAAVHILAVLSDFALVGDAKNQTIQIMQDCGFLDKMGCFLRYLF